MQGFLSNPVGKVVVGQRTEGVVAMGRPVTRHKTYIKEIPGWVMSEGGHQKEAKPQ